MNITQRATKVLQEIESALEMVEKATKGPWTRPSKLATHIVADASKNHGKMVCDCADSSPDGDQYGPDATFIATSRTMLPSSLRCLRTAIRGLLSLRTAHMISTNCPCYRSESALKDLCDQWEAQTFTPNI